MKKILTLLSTVITITAFSQFFNNHHQSFNLIGWAKKSENSIILSLGKGNENYIVEYDFNTKKHVFLNDSTAGYLSLADMNGNVGVGVTGGGDVYYTPDNWKTTTKSTTPALGLRRVIKTGTGYLGFFNTSSSSADYYYSANGSAWSQVTSQSGNNAYGIMGAVGNKVWLIGRPTNFKVSYDGGLTFTTKTPPLAPNVSFTSFIPYDTVNALATTTTNWYRTNDGGNSWKTITVPSGSSIVYTHKIDSIFIHNTTNGVQLSTDSGKTWINNNLQLPNNIFTRIYSSGKYLIAILDQGLATDGMFYSEGLNKPWNFIHSRLATTVFYDISIKGNYGIIGANQGEYYYTHDGGKRFEKWTAKLGSDDLMAVEVINDTLMLVADRKSNIWISKDKGLTFSKKHTNTLNFFGKKFDYSSDLSKIIMTRFGQTLLSTNYGDTWNTFISVSGSFDATITPNGKIYFAINASGSLTVEEITTTGNRTLKKTFSETGLTPIGIDMYDDNIGYYFASNATTGEVFVFKTSDSWNTYVYKGKFNNPATIAGQALYFHIPSVDTIYANMKNTSNTANSSNNLYYSYNGGATWNSYNIIPAKQGGTTNKMQGVHLFNGKNFISVWQDGRIILNHELKGNLTSIIKESANTNNHLNIKVYPNPFSDILLIDSDEIIEEIYVLDLAGKIVFTNKPNAPRTSANLGQLSSGIYFINIYSKGRKQSARIVKSN